MKITKKIINRIIISIVILTLILGFFHLYHVVSFNNIQSVEADNIGFLTATRYYSQGKSGTSKEFGKVDSTEEYNDVIYALYGDCEYRGMEYFNLNENINSQNANILLIDIWTGDSNNKDNSFVCIDINNKTAGILANNSINSNVIYVLEYNEIKVRELLVLFNMDTSFLK